MDWKNHLEKKSDPKNRKNSKYQSKLPHVNKKTTGEKSNFCSNTVFSLYFEIRVKKISRRKTTHCLRQIFFAQLRKLV